MAPASMKLVNLAKLDQPHRLHASATLRAHHDMIVDGNTHVAPRSISSFVILMSGWRGRVAGGMIVNDDDRGSAELAGKSHIEVSR
jgi:hypothetical protein